MRVPVTEAEKQKSYYKYFLREMVRPTAEHLAAIERELDPAEALPIGEKDRLFDEGYLPGERGWCRFPDGTGTIANLTPMPGVTAEMFDWWFAWHGLEPLRYKIWDPEDHYEARSLQPEQCRDSALSYRERYWNTCHDTVEGFFGAPTPPVRLRFRNPADVGFSREKLESFGGTIVCGGGIGDGCFMVHFLRPVPGGSELRSRFWFGWDFDGDGRPVRVLPGYAEVKIEPMRVLLRHTAKEFANLAAILPELFREEKDRF